MPQTLTLSCISILVWFCLLCQTTVSCWTTINKACFCRFTTTSYSQRRARGQLGHHHPVTTSSSTLTAFISPTSNDTHNEDGPSFRDQQDSTKCTSITNMSTTSDFRVLGVCGGIGSGKSMACKLLVSDLQNSSDGIVAVHIDTDSLAHGVYKPGSPIIEQLVAAFGRDILMASSPPTSQQDQPLPPQQQQQQQQPLSAVDNNKVEDDPVPVVMDTIDRKKLGAVVFGDRSAMHQLEQIVWPHVRNEIERRIAEIKDQWMISSTSSSTLKSDPLKSSVVDIGERDEAKPVSVSALVVVEAAVLLDAGWQDVFLDGLWVVTVPRSTAVQRLMEQRGLVQEDAEKRVDAQVSRRGIGNLEDEVRNRVVTAVIDNNGSLDELRAKLRARLKDPSSWY